MNRKQCALSINTENLFEQLCPMEVLRRAFREVRKNRGAPGIDGVSIETFEANLDEELAQLKEELISWRYKPKAVKQVELPKATGGIRKLGIPCIRDRVVQTAIKGLIEPILDPWFSDNSYGFRPNRNQQQAVKQAQEIVTSGKPYVVDIDLSKFFDRINQDKLIAQLKRHIKDKRLLRLIGMTLRSGVINKEGFQSSNEGVTQGSPLSPLLSNLVLDELDKELEKRGLSHCRFADDCNIFVGSRKAAERVMKSICHYIETKLKLVVNREKSQIARSERVKFLGMTIVNNTIAISKKAIAHAMQEVKQLTPRGTYETIDNTVKRINRWYVGWSSYYSMTQYPAQLKKIEAHIRRRLRARIVSQQKRRRHLYRKLVARGVKRHQAKRTAYSHRKRWALSHTRAVEKAYPNRWFKETLGQFIRSEERRPHWFAVDTWIKLT